MRITIAGAGAMGSRFGLMLHKGGVEFYSKTLAMR